MKNNELLTVQQFADAAGVSKQAVYKALNNKLMPYVQLVDGKKMLKNQALSEVYGVKVDQLDNPKLNNSSQPIDAIIAMLQKELDAKNKQIADQAEQLKAKDEQIKNLTSSIDNLTTSLQAEQALHGGTMQQLVAPEEAAEPADVVLEAEPGQKKRGFFYNLFKINKE